MHGTDSGPARRLADHEHALREEAYRLLTSFEGLGAFNRRPMNGHDADPVRSWADMMVARDRSPEDWPVAEILDILEAELADGDLAAARLIRPLRRLQKGVRRLGVLAWLAEDPDTRREAEAA